MSIEHRAFYFSGTTADGLLLKGKRLSQSKGDLHQKLLSLGIEPLHIQADLSWRFSLRKQLSSRVVTEQILIPLQRYLASGFIITDAFRLIGDTDEGIKRITQKMIQSLECGLSLLQTMKEHVKLDPLCLAAIELGERTDELKAGIKGYITVYQLKKEYLSKIKQIASYPLFLLMISLVITIGMVIFILPSFEQLFESHHTKLPPLTSLLMQISHGLEQQGFLIAMIGILFIFGGYYLWKQNRWCQGGLGHRFYNAIAQAPVIGGTIHSYLEMLWTGWMHQALSNHLSITKALQLAETISSLDLYQSQVRWLQHGIMEGESLASKLQQTGWWSGAMVRIITMGEQSGTLAQSFGQCHQEALAGFEKRLSFLTRWLEPLLMLCISGFVGVIVTAIYLPIFNLGSVMV